MNTEPANRRARWTSIFIALATICAGCVLCMLRTANTPPERVGPLPGGGFLLNSGWTIRPAGDQVPVGTLPMSMALSQNGKYLVVLNGGYDPPTLSVIDVGEKKIASTTRVPDAWLGLAFAPKTDRLYIGGGSRAMVYEFTLNADTGVLTNGREFAAVSDLNNKGRAFIGDVVTTADAHLLYAANLMNDTIAVINLQSGRLIDQWKCGRRPYRLLLSPDATQLFESSWADAAVYQYDASSGNEIGKTRVGPHPTDMLWINKPAPTEDTETSSFVARLFVTAANTNNVYSFGVTRDLQLNPLESINVSMSPMHPLGMTPSALAVNKEATELYAVCSDANAVAAVDISGAHSVVRGFIPTGWYPTAAHVLENGQLLVVNGKGLGSRPNPDGPNPTARNQPLYQGGPVVAPGYVAHIQTGTVSFIAPVSEDDLSAFTKTVIENSPYRDELLAGPVDDPQAQYFWRTPQHASPIRHVIYIIKENRTYDQVLGDLEKGNGDKSLNLFGESVTPNLHQLAREFVLYDNFYENADVSAEGHNWAAAAIAPDYTIKTWPSNYAGRKKGYDFEGGEAANSPPAGYLWDNAVQAGLAVRDYGDWETNLPLNQVNGSRQIDKIQDPVMVSRVDMNYRTFDLHYPDVNRAQEFIREWKQFEAENNAPNLMVLRLGNDHTEGTKPGALTPLALVADNDYACGQIVEAVSHSKLWPSTAIFIIEDDAQNGPDHVDSHRAPAWVLSPYTHRGVLDSTMYNQTSILRTMELILGLRPMTHFDAGARPMFASFSRQADTRPFTAISPKVSTTERNPANGPGSADSARMDFRDADRVDDDELNAVLWRAIKRTDPPAPTRSVFGQ